MTSAVNLVAVLEPALSHVSADQVFRNRVAELESGLLLYFLPVEKSETVVLPEICFHSSVINRLCNLHVVLHEPGLKPGFIRTSAPNEGKIGREIKCFVGINVDLLETEVLWNLETCRVRPEEVLDDLFAVEDVNL